MVWGKERSEHIGGGEENSRRGGRMASEYDDCVRWQTASEACLIRDLIGPWTEGRRLC